MAAAAPLSCYLRELVLPHRLHITPSVDRARRPLSRVNQCFAIPYAWAFPSVLRLRRSLIQWLSHANPSDWGGYSNRL